MSIIYKTKNGTFSFKDEVSGEVFSYGNSFLIGEEEFQKIKSYLEGLNKEETQKFIDSYFLREECNKNIDFDQVETIKEHVIKVRNKDGKRLVKKASSKGHYAFIKTLSFFITKGFTEEDRIKNEIATSKVSKMLGLKTVPEVTRFNGTLYSSFIVFGKKKDLYGRRLEKELEKVKLLCYLTGQEDAHVENIVVDKCNRLKLIDCEFSFFKLKSWLLLNPFFYVKLFIEQLFKVFPIYDSFGKSVLVFDLRWKNKKFKKKMKKLRASLGSDETIDSFRKKFVLNRIRKLEKYYFNK